MQCAAGEKQQHRAGDGHGQGASQNQGHAQAGGQQHNHPHRPHLGDHDFGGLEWQDQKVFDGAVFPLADQCGASQDDGEHRDVVDDVRAIFNELDSAQFPIQSGSKVQWHFRE